MSQDKDLHPSQAAPGAPEQADGKLPDQAAPAGEAPRDELAEARAEANALKDRLLRQMAEMENLRKRTEREKAESTRYAIARFARDMVTVADDLQRALASVPESAKTEVEAVRNLVDGVAVTERQLMQIFERHGLKRFDPTGERFDPERHEAMFEMPDPSVPAGTVAQVIEAGYLIGERTLRPARVGIARGGPKLAPVGGASAPSPAPAEPAAQDMSQAENPADPEPETNVSAQPEPRSPNGIGKKIDTSA